MTDKWIYALNSVAWSLVGVLATLAYQRIIAWYRTRRGEATRQPLSTVAWLGMFIVAISLASAAFSGSAQIEANRNADQVRNQSRAFQNQVACQNTVNQENASIVNERARRAQQDSDALNALIGAENIALQNPKQSSLETIQAAFLTYEKTLAVNNAYRSQHLLASATSTCGKQIPPIKK